MLYYVAREQHRYTIDRLLRTIADAGRQPPDHLRVATYEGLLAVKRAPIGSYVFTDLDRLTPYELEAATKIAHAVQNADERAIEINTNPNFPRMRLDPDGRLRRRLHVVERTLAGFKAMDGGTTRSGLTRFRTPKPKIHRLRNRSLWRRASDLATLARWRANVLLK